MSGNKWYTAGWILGVLIIGIITPLSHSRGQEAIAIAEISHDGPVDFAKEVLPILRRNCLACHNGAKAESDLVLETPESIRKGGGEGPAVVAGDPANSLLLMLAAHQRESFMPPPDNDVGAQPLSSDELGLIKLWIAQGAEGSVSGANGPIQWQPLPAGVNPIYAAAVSRDGQFAAAGRANQIFMYHVGGQRELGRLTDPSLMTTGIYQNPGVADLDLVQSLTFSPNGERLISGGFRTVKIWRRQRNVRLGELPGVTSAGKSLALSTDGVWAAIGEESGAVRIYHVPERRLHATLQGHTGPVSGVRFTTDGQRVISVSLDRTIRLWQLDGVQLSSTEAPSPLNALTLFAAGQQIATAGDDSVIRLWTINADNSLTAGLALAGHGQSVTSLATINDGQILSGSLDGTVRVWQTSDGQNLRQMSHGGPVVSVASTVDGSRFASASSDNQSAKIWNGADGSQLLELRGDFRTQLREGELVRAAALANRHIQLADADLKAAVERKTAEEQNMTKANEERTKAEEEFNKKVEAAKQPVADKEVADKELEVAKTEAAAAEERKKTLDAAVTTATEEQKVADEALKAATTNVEAATVAAQQAAEAARVAKEAAAADTTNQALADAAAQAEQASAAAEENRKNLENARVLAQQALEQAQAKTTAATAEQQTGAQQLTDAMTKLTQAQEKAKQVGDAAQKAIDERTAAERTFESAKRAVERSQMAVQKAMEAIPPLEQIVQQRTSEHQQAEARANEAKQMTAQTQFAFRSVAFSADQSTLSTSGDDQIIRIWDVKSGAPVDVIEGQGSIARNLAFTANGELLAAADNASAVLWQSQPTWTLERTIGSPDSTEFFVDRVTALDVSPDNRLLATGTGEPSRSGEIAIWNLEAGELVTRISDAHSDEIFALQFSRDAQSLVSCAADRFIKVFRVEGGQFVRAFEGHTHHVLGVAWSADGRQLSSGGADKVVKVWNAVTGDQLRTIQGFNKEVTAIRYLENTDQIVAACGDATVQVKSAESGGAIRNFGGASDFLYCVDVSADGNVIVAGGQDSVLRVWKQDGNVLGSFGPPATQ